ncbi:MAG: hypothetical protein HQK91_07295 [Nitrospirae bacterium]|nr:hypothetical protein [Nitrospirota bacterium]
MIGNITPLEAVRLRCIDCTGGSHKAVRECEITDCDLFPYRMKKGRPKLRVLRNYCLDCCNGQKQEAKECAVKKCSLFDYRFGKRPLKDVSTQKTMPAEAVLETNSNNMTKCINWDINL